MGDLTQLRTDLATGTLAVVSYTWQTGTAHITSETDTAPVVTAAENGPGTAEKW